MRGIDVCECSFHNQQLRQRPICETPPRQLRRTADVGDQARWFLRYDGLVCSQCIAGCEYPLIHPPVRTGKFATDSLARNESDHGVQRITPAGLIIMSTMNETDRRRALSWLRPNHFVLLHHLASEETRPPSSCACYWYD